MSFRDDIDAAVDRPRRRLRAIPERRTDLLEAYLLRGELRPYPVMYLGRMTDIDAGEHLARPVDPSRFPGRAPARCAVAGLASGPAI